MGPYKSLLVKSHEEYQAITLGLVSLRFEVGRVWYYDGNRIFPIASILKHKQVACVRRKMLFTIFKYLFSFPRYSSFSNMQISPVMTLYTQPNADICKQFTAFLFIHELLCNTPKTYASRGKFDHIHDSTTLSKYKSELSCCCCYVVDCLDDEVEDRVE